MPGTQANASGHGGLIQTELQKVKTDYSQSKVASKTSYIYEP